MATLLGMSCATAILTLLLVCIIGRASSRQWSVKRRSDPFHYLRDIGMIYRRSEDICKLCLGGDNCIQIEQSQCNYYMEASALMQDLEVAPRNWTDYNLYAFSHYTGIDEFLFAIADDANNGRFGDCIPYVSKYTNCHKENVCLGCTTCDCDQRGHWNCTLTQTCRMDALEMNLNHRSLLLVLDNLRKEDFNPNDWPAVDMESRRLLSRLKREIEKTANPEKHEDMTSLLSEWIYGVPPNFDELEDELADISDGTDEEDPVTTTERLLKFILHDPLYEVHNKASEFDGNSNKVKRSTSDLEAINKSNFFNVKNSDIHVETDVTDWVSNEKFLFGEFGDGSKDKNDETRIENANTNASKRDVKSILSRVKSIAAQYNTNYEVTSKVNEHIANKNEYETTSLLDMSILNDVISKVYQNTTNKTGSNNYNNSDLLNIKENATETTPNIALESLKDILYQDVPNREIFDEVPSIIKKRFVDSYSKNFNKVVRDRDVIVINPLDKDMRSENNLKELNNEDIQEWLNDQHPSSNGAITNNSTTYNSAATTSTQQTTDGVIALKDTIKDIDISSDAHEGYMRRKLPLSSINKATGDSYDMMQTQTISDDYMYDDETIIYEDEFMEENKYNFSGYEATTAEPVNYLTTTEAIRTAITDIVFDLLEAAKNQLPEGKNNKVAVNDTKSSRNSLDPVNEKNIDNASIIDNSIVKRDVSNKIKDNVIEKDNAIDHSTSVKEPKSSAIMSETIKDLMHDVLLPLNNILDDKQKELNELIKMKTGLIKFIKSSKTYDPTLNFNLNNSKTNSKNERNSYFSIYRLEIVPNFDLDYTKTNISILDRYMNKLKHDVYEVIRDIVGIQKMHTDSSKVPKDIRFLISAMKQYVHRKGFHAKPRSIYDAFRRQGDPVTQDPYTYEPYTREPYTYETYTPEPYKFEPNPHDLNITQEKPYPNEPFVTHEPYPDDQNVEHEPTGSKEPFKIPDIKQHIIKMIQLLDTDIIDRNNIKNTLDNVSKTARNILYRILTRYYIDEFAIQGLKVNDPHYNLTNDLNSIGTQWEGKAKILYDGIPTSQLYKMKILHLIVFNDINKIIDALSLIDFARSRRMMPIEESVGDNIISRIDNDLKNIFYVLQTSTVKEKQLISQYKVKPKENKKKESFIKQLKNLLVNSKKDILSLIHKKIPKSDIVRELAKKRLEDANNQRLSEYRDTMQRWQTQLNVIPLRDKRSAGAEMATFKKRMNNILPKYLRGKVPTNKISSLRQKLRDKVKPIRESNVVAEAKKIGDVKNKTGLNEVITTTTPRNLIYPEPKPSMNGPRKTGVKTQTHQKIFKKFAKKKIKKF